MITLFVDTPSGREALKFASTPVTIGRSEENDLRISSRFVSQQHCRIESDDEVSFRLVDLASQNGTLLNEESISSARLKPADCIRVGPVRIWFQKAPAEHTASLSPGVDDATDPNEEDIRVTARAGPFLQARLTDGLTDVMIGFRKNFGDERGLAEFEEAVLAQSGRVFPRTAFSKQPIANKLIQVAHAMAGTGDIQSILAMIMDAAVEITDSERGFLVLREPSGSWKVRIARNFDQEMIKAAEHKISRSIAEQVARTGKPVCALNAQEDRRFQSYASVSDLKLRSVMCVPLKLKDHVMGTLYVDNRFREGAYSEDALILMETFADHAAIALENARLYQSNIEQEQTLARRTEEVEELAKVLDERLAEAASRNAEFPKVLTREGLKHDYSMIIGDSPLMIEMFRLIDRVAGSEIPVLITGESGTGKELVAQAIHHNSSRKDKRFVKENCAAIPANLMESEFFGYRKGAFTGAVSDRKGLFEEAHGGTIFLDEIGEMSLDMQSKMLRVLQNGEIRPVGARETCRVNVRLLTATNRNLRQMVEDGTFREDLYYRLNVICIEVPPLRERMEDLPALVAAFLKAAAKDTSSEPKSIDPVAMRYLLNFHWPGNVRELQNEIQRAVALSGAVISPADLSREICQGKTLSIESPDSTGSLKDLIKVATVQKEREIILRTLEECAWKKGEAARKLQISRPTLDQKIRTFGLAPFVERGRHR
jgi:Nif-specific regulatory protein